MIRCSAAQSTVFVLRKSDIYTSFIMYKLSSDTGRAVARMESLSQAAAPPPFRVCSERLFPGEGLEHLRACTGTVDLLTAGQSEGGGRQASADYAASGAPATSAQTWNAWARAFRSSVTELWSRLRRTSACRCQLVGDQHPRRPALLLQQLAQQTLGRLGIAPALDQHVGHEAVLIDGPPQAVPSLTVMPRAASGASTIRRLSGKRKSSRTAAAMISVGWR